MREIALICFAAVMCVCSNNAPAQPSAGVVWTCWYDGEASVLCLLHSTQPPAKITYPAAIPENRLPGIVYEIRNDPNGIDGPVVIPLHTVPYDMNFVRQLAQSVMCAPRSGCTVVFGRDFAEATNQTLASR